MKLFYLFLSIVFTCVGLSAQAQLNGVGHCGALLTNYTNGASNDTVFYWPVGQTGTLTATPPSGTAPWDFIWQSYSPGINSWVTFTTVNDVPSSTQANLATGGYRVSIVDANGTQVGSYRAWVGNANPGSIQATHTADCMQVNLSATITGGTLTGYYNPPPDPFPINSSTQISVCFSANHTWVSDLGFFLVGPPSCGSPTITLAPNPGSIGMGAVCNNGNNVSNLCFSNTSAANFNVCTATTPLSGTYGSYGATPTAINWSALTGCDVTSPGWAVQIYDCIGLDVGSLTDATLSFSGPNSLGVNQTVTYTTPAGYSSPINDNSCNASSASIFTVPVPSATPLSFTCGYEWTADPYVFIPNANQLNTSLPAPPVPTAFTLEVVCTSGGQPAEGYINCAGSASNPTTYYTPVPWVTPALSGPSQLCEFEAGNYSASVPGGSWSGPGVTPAGSFSSAAGSHTLTYTPTQMCTNPASIVVQVNPFQESTETIDLGLFCSTAPAQLLGVYPDVSGPGITQQADGTYFTPSSVPTGSYQFESIGAGYCFSSSTTLLIQVEVPPALVVNPVPPVCETSAAVTLTSTSPGGTWTGNGIVDPSSGLFDPSVAGPGSWTIEYQTAGNCPSSGSIQVAVDPEPALVLNSPGLICSNGSPVQLSAQPVGGSWSGTGISPTGLFNPASAGAGSATITYSVTGICAAIEQFILDVTAAPQPDAGPDIQICEGETAVLDVGDGFDSVSWTPGGTGSSVTVSASGNYTVSASLGGCSASDQIVVTVIAMPAINLGPDQAICEGDAALITAPFSGNWSTGETGNSISVDFSGTVSYEYPNSGCPVGDEIVIQVFQNLTFDLGANSTICPGDSAVFTAGGYDAIWNDGFQGTAFVTFQEGTVTAQVSNGPCLTTDQVVVTLLPLPVADLGPDQSICLGEDILLDGSHPYNTDYLWSDGSQSPWLAEPAIQEGTFIYAIGVSNACGQATDQVTIVVEDCDPAFYTPNAFTPDNDGINDAWRPEVRNVTEYELLIFNRWGDMVFSTNDPQQYWTGNDKGGEHFVPDGVYLFLLKYATDKLDAGQVQGHVLVIR